MAQSIKLPDDIMALVRRESELQSRSVAGQVTHWLRIGRAIERSGHFDHGRIARVLCGEMETSELGAEEKDVWLDRFVEQMASPARAEKAHFAKRRRLGQGVGLDASGKIVHARDDGPDADAA